MTFESGENSTAVLNSFTITNGSDDVGGGIRILNSENVTITNCNIEFNSADQCGGGIVADGSSYILINNSMEEVN